LQLRLPWLLMLGRFALYFICMLRLRWVLLLWLRWPLL
jgi:hypothetical protein